MEGNTILNPNPLVKFLNKPQKEFTKADIIRYVTKNDIEMINFRYAGADGRLKTLNFIINSLEHLDSILTYGTGGWIQFISLYTGRFKRFIRDTPLPDCLFEPFQ